MEGLYEMHAHILADVDDGARNIEETKEILKLEYADGVRKIFLTPHYRKGMFETSEDDILKQYEAAKEIAKEIGEDFELILGCEFYASGDIEVLQKESTRTLGNTNFVLLEFSDTFSYRDIQNKCYELLMNNYIPIIAHAERYSILRKKIEYVEQIVDMGVYIQINASSILGLDGFNMKRFCKKLMKSDLLHFVGSDVHNLTTRKPLIGKCAKYVEKVMGEEYMKKIFIDNPFEIIK